MSTLGKGKASASVSGAEAYTKEQLAIEIQRLSAANAQLINDKMETEKIKVNLEADRTRLFGEKNSLIAKREELRTEIATLNAVGLFNAPVRSHQDPLLNQGRDKLKTKRPPPFDDMKKNLQRFFIGTRYYQGFYQQNLSFDFNKVQDIIVNIIEDVLQ